MSSLSRLVADVKSHVPKWAGGTQAPKPVVWLKCDELIIATHKNYPNSPVPGTVIKLLAGKTYVTKIEWDDIVLQATSYLVKPDLAYDAGLVFPPLSADRPHATRLHFM
jgi:uncharacterized protein YlzI (FlbEa/FlbD family)